MSERGTVKFFNPGKGFGFISRPGGEDVYVNIRDVEGGVPLSPGQEVEFELRQTPRGWQATGVVALEKVPRYGFVPIHPRVLRKKVPGHDHMGPGLLSGRLEHAVRTLGPLHVGTGVPVRSEDVELVPGDVLSSQYRVNGRPAIPGSTFKGVVRSVAEAVSPSCVPITVVNPFKLPREATAKASRPCSLERGACPACTLFGMMGYIGQVWFGDAVLGTSQGTAIHHVPPLYRPRGSEGAAPYFDQHGNFKGRKFYVHGRPQQGEGPALEVIRRGQLLVGDLTFINLTEAQLGLLFFALGLDGSFCLKMGAAKPVCLGSVRVLPALLSLETAEGLLGRSDAGEFYHEEKLTAYVSQRIEDAWNAGLLLEKQVGRLREILVYDRKELKPCPTGAY